MCGHCIEILTGEIPPSVTLKQFYCEEEKPDE